MICLLACSFATTAFAQELEPRRWSHLPIGANFGGGGYAHTSADVSFDPVLRLDDVQLGMESFPLKYIRSFEFLGKSARAEVWQAYQHARNHLALPDHVDERLAGPTHRYSFR